MKILFYGPLGHNIPKERVGGAEKGCLRSINLLRRNKYLVNTIEKPTMCYGFRHFIFDLFRILSKIIKELNKKNYDLFYIVGFYDKQVYLESLLVLIGRLKGIKIIYEPKNGGMVRIYNNSSVLYKLFSNYIFSNSNLIFCQGMEYVDFLKSKGYNNCTYLPNYISHEHMCYYNGRINQHDSLNLVYIGRLTRDKNIDLILDIFTEIHRRYENSKLFLIGGADKQYKGDLIRHINKNNITQSVTMTGVLDFQNIAGYLNKSKYFIFPSNNQSEGHSNALTEAMFFGVVPIASSIGFNRSVIGNDELIIGSFDHLKYANKIIEIEEKGNWLSLSEKMRNRVLKNYTEDIVHNRYIEVIEKYDK